MKAITDDGRVLDAAFYVEMLDGVATVVLESRSGNARNPDYHPTLRLLLGRLAAIGVSMEDAIVDSTVSRRRPFSERRLRVRGRPYPIDLAAETDLDDFRKALGAAQEPVAQRANASGGNRHKRIRMYLAGVKEVDALETFLAGGLPPSDDVLEALDKVQVVARPGRRPPGLQRGQGRGLSAPQRKAVEDRAMEVSTELLEAEGWRVRDVSRERRGYDLHAAKGGHQLHVEVKGTTGAGASVLLTRGEVAHARENAGVMQLSVVAGIKLRKSGKSWVGVGGRERRIGRPWRLEEGVLEPVGYEWVLPPPGG